ncbi:MULTISPECIES: tonB-system energizer ExbB [unclassified Ensifer]|uniref:tonB-system energizer ExbB n=1 Tax=unclassified Ensifer TaxID=2633371 RepID=UPI001FCDE18E|nr:MULTISPECIES: tonB-system energizer ExbB [unclassified Ensifer]
MPNRTRSKLNLLAAATLVLACGVSSTVVFAQTTTATETMVPVVTQVQNVEPAATAAANANGAPQGGQPATAQPAAEGQPTADGLAATASDVGGQASPASTEAPVAEAAEATLEVAANPVLPHDLSPVGMFLAADMVVKAVMIGLALASVITWAIFVVKTLELFAAKARLSRAVRQLSAANGLAELKPTFEDRSGPAAEMVAAAIDEMVRSEAVLDHAPAAGLKERVASLLTRIEVRAGKRMTSGTGILASIGSVGPFVGLFGTVWGIMNSFIGISKAQTTNLAIVAPGIAEALLATAIGLVAAIPAVIIYNYFARSVGGYKVILADAAAAVERLVSRDLDHRLVRKAQPRRQDGFAHPAEASIARIG